MKSRALLFLAILAVHACAAQTYTSYMTGDAADVVVQPTRAVVMAGGATDNDNAMIWMLQRANGGDVLVLRASGADGYNDYFYSELGVAVNSVETIVCNTSASGDDPYIVQRIQEAECIFFAGGDQSNYINFWLDSPVETALNEHILVKQGVIGGTSAGMAILGGHVFTAANGTITSATALGNPFSLSMTLSHDDFLTHPFLLDVITDTHYDDPDRRGRHVAFMAQMANWGVTQARGIACNEYVAVAIDENGIAHCFGEYPQYEEYVYFLRLNCDVPNGPEVIEPMESLTWNRNNAALKVYRANGRLDGSSTFDLNNWVDNNADGQWQNWWVESGEIFFTENASAPDCTLSANEPKTSAGDVVVTDPYLGKITVQCPFNGRMLMHDALGRCVLNIQLQQGSQEVSIPQHLTGLSSLVVLNADGQRVFSKKILTN